MSSFLNALIIAIILCSYSWLLSFLLTPCIHCGMLPVLSQIMICYNFLPSPPPIFDTLLCFTCCSHGTTLLFLNMETIGWSVLVAGNHQWSVVAVQNRSAVSEDYIKNTPSFVYICKTHACRSFFFRRYRFQLSYNKVSVRVCTRPC